jgi:hypothetical protein
MEMTTGAWALAGGAVIAAWVILTRVSRARRSAEFDAGGVSQSWLTEHKADKGDRFS